jgi:hypothetical protein
LSRIGGFIQQHEEWLSSAAYRDLKPPARCLLEEFQRIYRPGRNGQLSISVANAKKLLNVSKETASKAFYDLSEHGFIVLTKGGLWQERKAREWKLTIEPCGTHEPTDEWKSWIKHNPVNLLKKMPRRNIGQTVLKTYLHIIYQSVVIFTAV